MKMRQTGTGPFRKGHWSVEEDIRLIQFVRKYGEGRWSKLAKAAGLQRCGKSCRLRWVNYLRPDIKRGHISEEEERLIIKLHSVLGNRWSLIAIHLPGRSDNEIKNYWRSHIKKKLKGMGIDPQSNDIESSNPDSLGEYSLQLYETLENEGSHGMGGGSSLNIEGDAADDSALMGHENDESFHGETLNNDTIHDFNKNSIENFNSSSIASIASQNLHTTYNDTGIFRPVEDNMPRIRATTQSNESAANSYNCSSTNMYPSALVELANDPNCAISGAWESYCMRQILNPQSAASQAGAALLLHDSDLSWDVESIQPIAADAHNTPSIADNTFSSDLWDAELFTNTDHIIREQKFQAQNCF